MSSIPVKVVHRSPGEIRVQASGGCYGCGSACHRPRVYHLPAVVGSELVVQVAPARHFQIVLHSLLLPLIGFIGGAVLANMITLNDLAALCVSLLGLMVGVALCRTLPVDTLNIEEASSNE